MQLERSKAESGDGTLRHVSPESPIRLKFLQERVGAHCKTYRGKGRAQIDAATLQDYLEDVDTFYLANPFQLGNYAGALEILSSTSSEPVALLKKQLLGTEFNEFAGLGLSGTVDGLNLDQLQTVIIKWAEYLVENYNSFTSNELLDAKDTLDLINNSGE